jgi:HlyD family secretion protein
MASRAAVKKHEAVRRRRGGGAAVPRICQMKRRWMPAALLGTALAAAAGAWWWQRDGGEAVSYRTAKLERGSLQAAVASSGTVNPVSQVSVGSQVSGQIREMHADFNTEVRRGQLIARIDPESFEYKVRQASADVEAARAAVLNAQANVTAVMASVSKARLEADNAQRDLARKQDLRAQNFISQAEADNARNAAGMLAEALKVATAQVEVARAQVGSAQAVVRQREAALAQARVDLERTEIRSPVDGIVIKRSVDVGQTVAASLQAPELFIIARNLQDMQVEASIDEADIARVRVGQAVSFTIDAFPGRSFDGRVGQIRKAAVSAQNVVTYTVVVAFANPASTVLPGMTANVRIVTDTRDNVLKVPNAALRVRIAGVEPAVPAGAASGADGPRAGGVAPAVAGAASASGFGADRPPAAAATPRPGGGGGGPLAEFRAGLVRELQLTPAQQENVDTIFASARPRLAALRQLPEDERPKARERLFAELRAQVAEQLTPEQKLRHQQIVAEGAGRPTTRGRIYLLGADRTPVAHAVRLGISDGVATELIVTPDTAGAAAVAEGATVITGLNAAGASAAGTPPRGPRLPF